MSEKKRKSKRPKAMRVTTEASKAKLPRPRKKAQEAATSQGVATQAVSKTRANRRKKETWAEGYAKWEAKGRKAFEDARDSLTERNGGPRAIPCGEDVPYCTVNGDDNITTGNAGLWTPPDTSAYPWPLKFAWWLDGLPTRARRWLAVRLRWLAKRVAP